MRRSAEIAATSRADDLALRALAEIAAITSGENVRIVGGQMVALLMAAFPVPGMSPRRTTSSTPPAWASWSAACGGCASMTDRSPW